MKSREEKNKGDRLKRWLCLIYIHMGASILKTL